MSLFGESRDSVENRLSLMRKTHDLQVQEFGELVRGLQSDVDHLKHKLELALSASRRWERMHDREHQERKWLENRVALLESENQVHRLEVCADPVNASSDPLEVSWVDLTPDEISAHNSVMDRDAPSDHPITVRRRGRPRKVVVDE